MRSDPYAPPTAELSDGVFLGGDQAEWEQIRRAHLTHEARIRSVSLFFTLPAIGLGLGSAGAAALGVGELQAGVVENVLFHAVIAFLLGLMSAVNGWVGLGLRRLNPPIRTIATVLTAFKMLMFPIGIPVFIYIIYLLQCANGALVFSEKYGAIRAATPHIVYRTSTLAWGVLIALILGAASILAASV